MTPPTKPMTGGRALAAFAGEEGSAVPIGARPACGRTDRPSASTHTSDKRNAQIAEFHRRLSTASFICSLGPLKSGFTIPVSHWADQIARRPLFSPDTQIDRSGLRSKRGCQRRNKMPRRDALSVKASAIIVALVFLLGWPSRAAAYAVLAHEAIVDSAWDSNIRPLLLKRFPGATPEQLKEAHGYAYGGAIIQDMGYYPHGSFFFSDLTHYVRSGDFILALLRDSQDLNGYAFALGALAHYAADNNGHPAGTNRAVPLLYPKLEKKYGNTVTYEQDRLAHVKTEFGFDVLEVAQGRYAPENYHDFIGFDVSVPLLEQAFQETYGLDLKSVLTNEEKVLGSYRYDVSQLLPRATRIAWSL